MKLARFITVCIALLMVFSLQGWSQSSPAEAFENVIIHTADGNTIESGTIVWRNGVITSVGEDVPIPFDAYVYNGGDSLHIYPGFIDGMAQWGSPEPPENLSTPDEPGNPSYKRAGIQPHRHPANLLNSDADVFSEVQKHGFTTAALGLKGQMLPGQIDLFFINGEKTNDRLLESGLGVLAQFEEAQGAAYPSTTMALMVRYRQLFYNAQALRDQQNYFASTSGNYPAPDKNKVLESLYPVMDNQQPFFFVVDSKENIERLFWLQDELGFNVVVVSGEEAYGKAEELAERDIPVLASIDLPDEPEWRKDDDDEGDEEEKESVEKEQEEVTEEMQHFRDRQLEAYLDAVNNINNLIDAGVKVGYASNGLKLGDIKDNIETLKEEGGLTDEQILQILTQSTADILGYGQKMGDLQEGRIASFTVFTKPFTDEDTKAVYSVSGGELTEFEPESN
jgi:hypothetical protein